MRHNVYGKKLSRTKNQRTALFRSLVQSLILHESIQTTSAKASAVKGLVDRLVTQAKSENTRRLVSQFLTDKRIFEKLVNDLAPRLSDRNSGYTSVVRLGYRQGDGAMIVQMKLLTQNKVESKQSEKVATKAAEKTEKLDAAVEVSTPAPKVVKAKVAKVKKEVAK